MATKKSKQPKGIDGVVLLGREALFGTVDDVERCNVGGQLLVMRAKSTSAARQVIDLIDVSAAPVVTKSIKTKIGRGVVGVERQGTSFLVGGYHGYTVVDLESGKTHASLTLDDQTWCRAFTLVGSKVLFAQSSVEAAIPPGLYEHPLGKPGTALKKLGELPARRTEGERRWARCDSTKVWPHALVHRGNEVVLITDEGLISYQVHADGLTEKRRVALNVGPDFLVYERFGPKHAVLLIADVLTLVDLEFGATRRVFEPGDGTDYCRDGERIYAACFEKAVIRAARIDGDTVHELPSTSFAFAKPSARDAEYPFNSFWVTGNRVVVTNHVKSGFIFDGWPAASSSAS